MVSISTATKTSNPDLLSEGATASVNEEFFGELVENYGSPLYAYDLNEVSKRCAELKSFFPTGTSSRLMYSFKANPLPSVAGELHRNGCEADLTSAGEIAAAIEAGFDLSNALYGGPGKSVGEIDFAIENGIRQFSIESWTDLSIISSAAEKADVTVRGLFRVNPLEAPKAKLAMSGVASQFGFEEDCLLGANPCRMQDIKGIVDIVGVHIYWGTQVGGPDELLACFTSAVETAQKISRRLDFPLQVLNFGGGFPWPYSHVGSGPDLSPLREGLAELLLKSDEARDAEWWFESGRYLVASSGTLLTRVMDIKESKGKKYLILDTGIHHLGGMSGLGRIPRFNIDIEVPGIRRDRTETQFDVVGQLCTPLDCIGRKISLPELQIGDLVTVPNTGAYGLTGSVIGFLSRPTPVEVAYRHGEIEAVYQMRSGHEKIS